MSTPDDDSLDVFDELDEDDDDGKCSHGVSFDEDCEACDQEEREARWDWFGDDPDGAEGEPR